MENTTNIKYIVQQTNYISEQIVFLMQDLNTRHEELLELLAQIENDTYDENKE